MPILSKMRNVLFGEDTSSYGLSLQEMKDSLSKLIEVYNNFVELQEEFKKNPSLILNGQFEKKEKYPEIMDKIKYKDVELIKEYELYAIRYNILVELYNKLKIYISELKQDFILDFKVDKYKQTVATLSQYKGNINKILLVKNSFINEDYLYYKVGNNIEILDICSKEPNVHHGTFMVEALIKVVQFLNKDKTNYNEIVVLKELSNKIGFQNCAEFFKKQGFMVLGGMIIRKIG